MERPIYPYQPEAAQKRCLRQGTELIYEEMIYTPDLLDPPHAHRQAGLYLTLQGTHTVVCRKTSRLVEPGTLIFHPAGEPHQCCFHTQARIFQIYLAPSWLERLGPYLTILDRPSCHDVGAPTQLAWQAFQEFRSRDDLTLLVLEGLSLQLLASIARCELHDKGSPEHRPPHWLLEACDLLHDLFAESLSIDRIAQAVDVHPAHLSRMFRRYYRSTVGEYLRDLRLKCACRMLSTSAMPLAEIALSCGYSDQSHFSTAFKRHTGLTPREYRKNFRTR